MVITTGTAWKNVCLKLRSLTVGESKPKLSPWSSRGELYQMQVATKSFSMLRRKSFNIVLFLCSFSLLFSAASSLTHMHLVFLGKMNGIGGHLCVSCAACVGPLSTRFSRLAYEAQENGANAMYLQ